jgi:hypothetical protein
MLKISLSWRSKIHGWGVSNNAPTTILGTVLVEIHDFNSKKLTLT